MLKCGGMLSKAHSVCVPNKLTMLRKFPLLPEETGVVYYTKSGHDGKPKKQRVRPRIVKLLWTTLKKSCPPYAKRSLEWVSARAQAVFQGVDCDTAPLEQSVEIELPTIHVGDEPDEDVGPAAGQHPGAAEEADETTSGFFAPVPTPDVQASIEQALAAARGRVDRTANDESETRPAADAAPGIE